MASSIFFRPLVRPQTIGLGLAVTLTTFHITQQRPLRLDSNPILSKDSYRANARTPIVRNGQLTAGAVRQISSGSIVGMSISCFEEIDPFELTFSFSDKVYARAC